jgi:hypothetical protein
MPDDSASVFEFMFPTEVWGPVSNLFSSSLSLVSFILFWFVILTVAATYVDSTKEIPGAWNPWAIFWIIALNALLLLIIAWWFSPVELPYIGEVLSSAPNTCIAPHGSLENGLCYKDCEAGFHGYLTRCYADKFGRGVGTAVGFAHPGAAKNSWCPDGWVDDLLLCRSPIKWDNCGFKDLFGTCWPKPSGGQVEEKRPICPGPSDFGPDYRQEYWKWRDSNGKGDPAPGETLVEANAANHKTCADVERLNDKHSDLVDGLCYKPCPKDYPERYPAEPYHCYKGGRTSYERGVGRVPPAFRLLKKYAVNIPPKIPTDTALI